MKKWSEVVASGAYGALSPQEQDEARHDYFRTVIAPQVPQEDQGAAWGEFDTYSSQFLKTPPATGGAPSVPASTPPSFDELSAQRDLADSGGVQGPDTSLDTDLGKNVNDIGRGLLAGVASTGQQIAEAGKQVQAFVDPVQGRMLNAAGDQLAEKLLGRSLSDIAGDAAASYRAGYSPETQAAQKKLWWDDKQGKLGDAWSDPRAYISGIAESLPGSLLMAVPGAAVARGAYVAKLAALAESGVAKDVAIKEAADLAAKAAGLAGSISEGILGGGQSAQSVRDDINQMTPEQLQSSDAYKALRSQGYSEARAKAALAEDGATKGFLLGGIATGIFGGMGDRVLARAITSGIEGGVMRRIGLGALSEGALEELPQNYFQQIGENVAKRTADPTQSLTEGALNQALGGAAIGAVQGGGMAGALGHSAEKPTASKVPLTGDLRTDIENIAAAPVTQVQPITPRQTTPAPMQASSPAPVVSDAGATGQDAAAVATNSPAEQQVQSLMSALAPGDVARPSDQQPFGSESAARLHAQDAGLEGYQPVAVQHGETEGYVLRKTMSPEQIDAAAHEAATSPRNDTPQPTGAQMEAGNYKLGHVTVQGLDISVENPAGSARSGVDASGKSWSVTMQNHYGYIRGTTGRDKDHVDVFLGPNPTSQSAYIVDQVKKDGAFDEHKVMLGFNSMQEADRAYHSNYAAGWTGRGAITEMPMSQFRSWVADPANTSKPLAQLPERSSAPTNIQEQPQEQPQETSREQQPADLSTSAIARDTGGAGDVTAVSVLNAGLRARGIEAAVAQPADVAGWLRDPVHRAVIESSRAFGALFGKRVVLVKSAQEGRDLPFNGAIRSLAAPRHIFINAASPEVSPLAVAGHELTHHLRASAPDLYNALAKVVHENADFESFDTDFRARFKSTTLTRGQIHEEMVADIVGNRILEPATWRALAERDPNKFRAFAKRVIAQLSEWIGKAKGFAVDHLIVGEMERIREKLVETLAQYAEHLAKPETKERDDRHDEVTASAREGIVRDAGAVRGSAPEVAVDRGPERGAAEHLEGAPREVDVPGRGKVAFGIYETARDAAAAYAKKAGIPYVQQTTYVKVDRERAQRIAAEYDAMVHAPNDPEVKAAYAAMISETLAQYEAILGTGLKVEFIDTSKGDPYAASPRLAILDVIENNHLWVFPTNDGFGSSDFDPSTNPLLAETKFKISGKTALANDIFRVVHDYFGHIENGVGFRADGEENAWRSHSVMYTPLARRAMTSETRGQNSWVNFGPHGDENRTASAVKTVYADQKTGLLPEWVVTDGAIDTDAKFRMKDREGDTISTRNPTGKRATENPHEQMLSVGIEAMKRDADAFAHNVSLLTSYPGFRADGARTADQKAERFVKQVTENLLWLHDKMAPELRARARKWYDGANKIAKDFARTYELTARQTSGILAALSPQKDWFQNVSLGKRVMETMAQHQNTPWTPEMSATADRLMSGQSRTVGGRAGVAKRNEHLEKLFSQVRGKKLSELSGSLIQQAAWVRIFDETYNARTFPVVTPEGSFSGLALNQSGSATKVAWGDFKAIANAISIFRDGSIENISNTLGMQHKVRSFYNNIVEPNSTEGHVTIVDTHAVAAALVRPLSGSSREVLHNFGNNVTGEPGTSNSIGTGIMGTYPIYAEAYRRAAEKRDILPREMQSITWEAVRGLFSPEFKRAQIAAAKGNDGAARQDRVDTIDHIWENYSRGKVTAQQARNAVFKAAGGIAVPEWAGGRPAGEVDAAEQRAGDAGVVPQSGVPGRDAAVDSGAGSAAAARAAEAVPEVAFSRKTQAEQLVDEFGEDATHDGVELRLAADSVYGNGNVAVIQWIERKSADKGAARTLLQSVTNAADRLGVTIRLAVTHKAERAKLVPYYRQLGFKKLMERGGDYLMQRDPADDTSFARKWSPEAVSEFAKDHIEAALNSKRTVSLWDRTVGTQINLARKSPEFRRVFDKANEFIRDISYFASTAADLAPNLLPKLESVRNLGKGLVSTMTGERQAALSDAGQALYGGTLDKRTYTDAELTRRGVSEQARAFYAEARAAVDKSLEQTATSIMHRMARAEQLGISGIRDMTMMKARDALTKELRSQRDQLQSKLANEQQLLALKTEEFGKQLTPEALAATLRTATENVNALQSRHDALVKMIDDVNDVAGRVVDLQNDGYFPLMRWGQYTLYATRGKEQLYFGMFESEAERVKMERSLRRTYPDAAIKAGVANDEYYKLFAGINLDSLEVFAQAMGASEQQVFQNYLKLAVANRSALKRMIERKEIAGFNTDVTRTLAQFLTSNARMASRNYHWAEAKSAVNAIPKEMGDVQKQAVGLLSYIENPEEEGQTIRGLNFMWHMAGNISTALINMTQPVMSTLPYLSRFGATNATKALARATATLSGRGIDTELRAALKLAADKGVTQPHEIHFLYGEQQRTLLSGDTRVGTVWRRFNRLIGEPFAIAESINRHVTFVAAYDIARGLTKAQLEQQGVKSPFEFAMKAVDDTQFVYNKANRPTLSRGTVGGIVFQFKSYSISMVELFSWLAKQGPEGRKAAMMMLGIWMLAAGFMGLPYEEDIEDLIDTIGQSLGFDTNLRATLRDGFFKGAQAILGKALGDVAAEVAMHGISGLLPLDVQGRLSFSDMIPATGVAKRSSADRRGKELSQLLGPSGSIIDAAFAKIDAFQSGEETPPAFFPSYIRNVLQAVDMMKTGAYRDAKGRTVVATDAIDATIKMLGFTPAKVARAQRKMQVLAEQVSLQKVAEKDFSERAARAIADAALIGTPKAEASSEQRLESVFSDIERWNARNPDTPVSVTGDQIRKRVHEMLIERDVRFVKSAPRELRGRMADQLLGE